MKNVIVVLALATTALVCCTEARAQTITMPPTPSPSGVPSAAPSALPSPDPALTKRLQAIFTDTIAGRPPTQDLTPVMQSAMTVSALVPVKQYYDSLGTLQQLHYLSHDRAGTFDRYHFLATFSNGSQKVMFVLDSTGALAGFFDE